MWELSFLTEHLERCKTLLLLLQVHQAHHTYLTQRSYAMMGSVGWSSTCTCYAFPVPSCCFYCKEVELMQSRQLICVDVQSKSCVRVQFHSCKARGKKKFKNCTWVENPLVLQAHVLGRKACKHSTSTIGGRITWWNTNSKPCKNRALQITKAHTYIHVFVQIIWNSDLLICICDGQVHKSTDTSTAQPYAKHNPTATTGKNRNNIPALVVADFAFHVEDRVI